MNSYSAYWNQNGYQPQQQQQTFLSGGGQANIPYRTYQNSNSPNQNPQGLATPGAGTYQSSGRPPGAEMGMSTGMPPSQYQMPEHLSDPGFLNSYPQGPDFGWGGIEGRGRREADYWKYMQKQNKRPGVPQYPVATDNQYAF